MSNYNPYPGIPTDFMPTRIDEMGLFDIILNVKECIKLRHDFHTAVAIAEKQKGVRQFPGPPPKWGSNFAQTYRPDAKTLAGLAKEHKRLAAEAQSYVSSELRGNAKLAGLFRQNLRHLFPDIGYDESTGEYVLRLRTGGTSALNIFKPLGVEDSAKLIKLMMRPPVNNAFYW